MAEALVVEIKGRVVGRRSMAIGVALIRLGAWFLARYGIEVEVDGQPLGRVTFESRYDERPRPSRPMPNPVGPFGPPPDQSAAPEYDQKGIGPGGG